jgi:hypothetical protein
MITNFSSIRSVPRRTALIALTCSLVLVSLPALQAAEAAMMTPPAPKAPSLPVTASFAKGTARDKGPYVLTLTNTSNDALKVTTTVLLSVAYHGSNKHWDLPEHLIAPGESWAIPDLTAGDKLTITAPGFAPLELTVP